MLTVGAALAGAIAGWAVDLVLGNAYRSNPLFGAPSRCGDCRAPASAMEFVPLIGAAVRTRCPSCKFSFWPRSLLLSGGGAAAFALCLLEFSDLGQALLGGFFCLLFLALTATDIERRLLPDRIVIPGIILAICTAWLLPDLSVTDVFIGGALAVAISLGMLIISLPFGGGALGMGDLKLTILMGFLLGPQALIVAVFVATLSAGLIAVSLLLTRQRRFGDYIPHGPFLAIGAIVGLLWGSELWDWYSN